MKLLLHPAVEAERLEKIIRAAGVMKVVNAADEAAALREIADADGFYGKITPPLLDAARKLRWVQTPTVSLEHYLVVSMLLFSLGLAGVIMRRNLLIIYMSLELMLNAANLALVAFSRFKNLLDGQILVFFIITVAAAEVSVGLALIVALYRKRQTAHVEDLTS